MYDGDMNDVEGVNITELGGFKLVYQGGHHNIYCDGSRHLKTSGGRCHPPKWKSHAIVDYEFNCDCERYKNGRCCS